MRNPWKLENVTQPSEHSSPLHLRDRNVVSPRNPPLPTAVRGLGCAALVWALSACASAPSARTETVRKLSPSEEAEAIEAAKRHPIARTYERPRDPSPLPVAPAPIPPEPAAPPPPPSSADGAPERPPAEATSRAEPAPPPARDEVIVVGQDPPSTVTTYAWPETEPDERWIWVDGGWVERPRYRAYIDGRPAGWGYRGWYQPRPWLAPPVVVVPGARSHWHHPHRHVHPSRYVAPSPRYRASPRREVHVAPPARERGAAVRQAPTYRAPAARQAPASRDRVHSAPPSSRRAVRVR